MEYEYESKENIYFTTVVKSPPTNGLEQELIIASFAINLNNCL